MLSANKLAVVLKKIPSQTLTRNMHRAVDLDKLLSIIPPQPLFALGPGLQGQRFTPKGGPAALYVSEHLTMAFYEANGLFANQAALALQSAPATVIFTLRVHLERVLDITDIETQRLLGTTEAELTSAFRWQQLVGASIPTQILGDVVFASGLFQAIRYPSNLDRDQVRREANLVIWTDRLIAPSFIEVLDTSGKFCQRIPEKKDREANAKPRTL